MILIGLGANLPSAFGSPVDTLENALVEIAQGGEQILRRSSWYETAPVPVSDQPWYINGVVQIESSRSPADLLEQLHAIEEAFGRVRVNVNEARVVDLDLLDYNGIVSDTWPVLPHPRLHERGFVLWPLAEIAPAWRHPILAEDARTLADRVDPAQITRILEKKWG